MPAFYVVESEKLKVKRGCGFCDVGTGCFGSLDNAAGSASAPYRPISNEQSRARTLALPQRSFDLTCAVVRASPKRQYLDDPSRIVWRELVKSITSSTFNMEEADAASSDADFLAKMRIALREIKEARVAIRIIVRCELAGHDAVRTYEDEARQFAMIFGKINRQ